ncbi:uncharacterized protein EV154DRAFT_485839 [Mucor mucedo]|uniref:uncharacterized protein n=1 Tax=Mucor mucedo TaxID=29922 RepID=UPI00221F285E|nr:uncharacterized protein EV154DRAFT_485839 [Mucor mucedo]KAI7880893.1 hypothetical protein EV154DRAFT_485839 [Mucor mucedo]
MLIMMKCCRVLPEEPPVPEFKHVDETNLQVVAEWNNENAIQNVQLHIQLGGICDYFRAPVHIDFLFTRAFLQGVLTSIPRETRERSTHPFLDYYPNCLYVQIDGIKFGKRKYNGVVNHSIGHVAYDQNLGNNVREAEVHEPSIFTRGTDGNPPGDQELIRTRAAIREAWYLAKFNRRAKNIQVEEANHLAKVNRGRTLLGEVDVSYDEDSLMNSDNDYEAINEEVHVESFVNSNWRSPSPVVVDNMSSPNIVDGSLSPELLHGLHSPSLSANEAAAVDAPILYSPSNSPVPSPIVRRTRTRGSCRRRGCPRSLKTTTRARGRNSHVNRR